MSSSIHFNSDNDKYVCCYQSKFSCYNPGEDGLWQLLLEHHGGQPNHDAVCETFNVWTLPLGTIDCKVCSL